MTALILLGALLSGYVGWRIRLGATSPKQTRGTALRWTRQARAHHRRDRAQRRARTPVLALQP
jgi:hypothetical protein